MNLHSEEISLQIFFYFKLFFCPPDEKNAKIVQGFYPQPPPGLCHQTIAEFTSPQDAHVHFTKFKNSVFVQKETLEKLLGQMFALSIIDSCSYY